MNQMLLYGIEYCHIKTLNQMQPHVLGCCHSLHQCVRWIISISAGRSQGITEICHVLQPLHLRMVRKDKMTSFDSKSPSLSLLRDTSLCLQREEVGKRRETRRGRVLLHCTHRNKAWTLRTWPVSRSNDIRASWPGQVCARPTRSEREERD